MVGQIVSKRSHYYKITHYKKTPCKKISVYIDMYIYIQISSTRKNTHKSQHTKPTKSQQFNTEEFILHQRALQKKKKYLLLYIYLL